MSDTDHIRRIKDELQEIDHRRYVKVIESPWDSADVRVQVADHMENSLINNGQFEQFHDAGYVAYHVNFERELIDLRSVEVPTGHSENPDGPEGSNDGWL